MNPLASTEMNESTVDPSVLDKYSSAITLADMEIFIYPELLYSLVLANIMSPRVWTWREDPWFKKIDSMNPYRRVLRLKQYIIDHYEFNLDLDTWGLTTKETELARFKGTMDEETLGQSNALFGYHGDKYYFDIDIRKHFGLDKYGGDVIPYWKTETVEAMDAFQHKDEYNRGAGECVSLSTLYAAALYVVCKIPLEQIFLMATPLHSQNFVDVKEGVLTNNRRVVSKAMWFNGSELSAKAQRALRNEKVTIVANNTGYIHTVYPDATIKQESYDHFKSSLTSYLKTDINMETLANFLRYHSKLQTCFQIKHVYHGKPRFIAAEKVYSYEHNSSYLVSDNTRDKLLEDIDEYEFFAEPIVGRIPLNKFEDFFKQHRKIDLDNERDQRNLMEEFNCYNAKAWDILQDLKAFTELQPRLPDGDASPNYVNSPSIDLDVDMTREGVINYLESIRADHPIADLSFYAYRDLTRTDWTPFMVAAMQRNPVIVEETKALSDDELIQRIADLPNESTYDGPRLAQPDEVWNFQRGDGLERAIALANVWKTRYPSDEIEISATNDSAEVVIGGRRFAWPSSKRLEKRLTL